ncbi:MAG: SRPBCC family protein [Edaphobacter sp.]
MSQTAIASPSLVVSRTYPASIDRVFKAWTDANQLGQWFAPSDDYTTKAAVDLRIDHEYRFAITHKDGNVFTVFGTYRLIDSPNKLVYTWRWEGGPSADTLVTVDFTPEGDATKVTITHEQFVTTEDRDRHSDGWNRCLARLPRLLEASV